MNMNIKLMKCQNSVKKQVEKLKKTVNKGKKKKRTRQEGDELIEIQKKKIAYA